MASSSRPGGRVNASGSWESGPNECSRVRVRVRVRARVRVRVRWELGTTSLVGHWGAGVYGQGGGLG